MRILVTGGFGFIGSHVVDRLQETGHTVCIMDDLSTGERSNVNEAPQACSIHSVANASDVNQTLELFQPDTVIHLAAQSAISKSLEHPAYDMKVNGIGTLNVIEAAIESGVKRFIFSSTSAVYRDHGTEQFSSIKEEYLLSPSNPYGISKLAAEGYVRTMLPNSTILRLGNVYGPRQHPLGENQVIARMIRHFEFGDEFYIHGSGNQRRDFVYVSDVVDAVVTSLDGEPGTYNISTAKATSVNEISVMVRARYEQNTMEHTDKEDPRSLVCMNNSLAKKGLGWEPKVDIYDGINRTIDWWKAEKAK